MAVISKLCLVSSIRCVLLAARSHRDNPQVPLVMLGSGGRITDATSSRLVPLMRVRGWRVPTNPTEHSTRVTGAERMAGAPCPSFSCSGGRAQLPCCGTYEQYCVFDEGATWHGLYSERRRASASSQAGVGLG